ncbi:MAG TPA: RloB family protein [Pyrinomonadaceae bacterium]|nr:RloB family protein [Pyrinomonadaceae bacterium]
MARKGRLLKASTKIDIERPVKFRRYEYFFLIVCEDQKTEPSYFETFKSQIPKETLYLATFGKGKDPKSVVEEAVKERDILAEKIKKEIDVVWAVFDKDDADLYPARATRFEEAFKIAEHEKIEIAYSNEVFELWLLLHFTDVDSEKPLPRKEVYKLIQKTIRKIPKYDAYAYDHSKYNPATVKIILEFGDVEAAIERAEVLFEKQKERKPIEANPSTKVHILIKELLALIEYYNFVP